MRQKKQQKLPDEKKCTKPLSFDIIKGLAIFSLAFLVIFTSFSTRTTINAITLTPANPTTLSNGLGYYLAGKTYNFSVQVIDPDAVGWADITQVRLLIPNSTAIDVSIDPSATGLGFVLVPTTGNANVTCDITGSFNSFTALFHITPKWSPLQESIWTTGRTIQAWATSTNTLSTTQTMAYGVCESLTALNLTQNGVAADGYVNKYHTAFAVTTHIVYNVPGASISDDIRNVPSPDLNLGVTPPTLYDGITLIGSFTTPVYTSPCSYNVPAASVTAPGAHTWNARVTSILSGTITVNGTKTLTCDEIEITEVRVVNGGGVDVSSVAPVAIHHVYYRGINITGAQLTVSARMRYGGGNIIGNTNVNISDGTNNYTVLILNNTGSGTANISPYPAVAAGATTAFPYTATTVSGGVTDTEQNIYARILQPGNNSGTDTVVNWDNLDPPGPNAISFTTFNLPFTQGADSVFLKWNVMAVPPVPDLDFYTWRIYYTVHLGTVWTMVDRNTSANYSSGGSLGDLTLISTLSATINGLAPLTAYDFKISAVDVLGNEVATGNQPIQQWSTSASSINCSITDGITTYDDNTFTLNPLATARPLRNTAIRIKFYIVTGGNTPEQVNLLAAQDIAGTIVPPPTPPAGTTNWCRIPCIKTAPNTYTGYIPATNPLITIGSSVCFILEAFYNGSPSYADHNTVVDSEPDSNKFNFIISNQPSFTPWPVRILNNVIDESNPVAYPSFYLSDDAYVTITIYDIKGRPVTTLLEKAFRKGGQNIKESGWDGRNKSKRMCSDGLYYVRIEAKRASDKKIIISETKKVILKR